MCFPSQPTPTSEKAGLQEKTKRKSAVGKIVTSNHARFSGRERTPRVCVWNRKYFIHSHFIEACFLPGTALHIYHSGAPETMTYPWEPSPLHFSSPIAIKTSPMESMWCFSALRLETLVKQVTHGHTSHTQTCPQTDWFQSSCFLEEYLPSKHQQRQASISIHNIPDPDHG